MVLYVKKTRNVSWLLPSETYQLVELVRLCYGDKYPDTTFYNAQYLERLIREEKLFSAVIKEENKVVAHLCFIPSEIEMACQFLCGLVHPKFRGNHFLSSIMEFIISFIRETGRVGCYGEMVMYNTVSQKSSILAGGGECAFFYGRIPPSYKEGWDNTIVYFFPAQSKLAPIYNLSSFYIREIFSIAHRFDIPIYRKSPFSLGKENKVSIRVMSGWCTSEMLVEDLRCENNSFWEQKLTVLRREPIRAIYLNLSHPHINRWIEMLRHKGYFFAGVIPHLFSSGSALILQNIDLYRVSLSFNDSFATDFGKRLFGFCEKDRTAVFYLENNS